MVGFRRILKFAPAVAMLLLAVAWGASVGREFGVDVRLPTRGRINTGFENGTFFVGYHDVAFSRFYCRDAEDRAKTSRGLGRFKSDLAYHADGSLWRWWFDCPVPFLLCLMLPIAVGATTGFRFRLWHYLAFTALVACQLAYYL